MAPAGRSRAADDVQGVQARQREEAALPAPSGPPLDRQALATDACRDAGAIDATGRALVPPAAIQRIAVEAGRLGDGAFVELRLGQSWEVVLRRSPAGLELHLDAGTGLRSAARAELPGLVARLRADGIVLARAEVRGGASRAPGRRAR
jgi:hypothetical protein